MAYNVTGTPGNDNLDQSADDGPGTIVGLAGDDRSSPAPGWSPSTAASGDDTVILQTGNTGTVNGGTENDSILCGSGEHRLDGAVRQRGRRHDQVSTASSAPQTIVGGNDSNDGARQHLHAAAAPTSSSATAATIRLRRPGGATTR